jgi:plasmid stability protein
MAIKDLIAEEVANLRAKAAKLRTDTEAEAQKIEAQALALENKTASLPAEFEALTEEAAHNVWAWIKSL